MFSTYPFSSAPFSDAGQGKAYTLSCDAGSYTLTGNAATFTIARTLSAGSGSYVYTGYAASLNKNYVLQSSNGSYSINGQNVSFTRHYEISASNGSYTISGQNAGLVYGKFIDALPGSYAITGYDATFARTYVFTVQAGNYTYIGKDATFEYNPAPIIEIVSKGGLPEEKKRKAKLKAEKESREELEAIVKREFDILDGTYQPEAVEVAKEVVLPKIKEIDYTQYQIALGQVNALLLQAKIKAAEYEAELDDEEALLMLL